MIDLYAIVGVNLGGHMLSFARRSFISFSSAVLIVLPMLSMGSVNAATSDPLVGSWTRSGDVGGVITISASGTGFTGIVSTAYLSSNGCNHPVGQVVWTNVNFVSVGYYTGTNHGFNGDCTDLPQSVSFSIGAYSDGHLPMTVSISGFGSSTWARPASAPTPTAVVWPPLPDALVSIESVSNGCGGGDAGTDPKYGDDSEYINSEIPYADESGWNSAHKYYVNFREACKQHDAAYSHAKVNGEMTLRGRPKPKPKIVDYFTWTKQKIDTKFLADMIKICEVSIPKTAKIALNNCKNYGGFHTVSGAKTRFNLVAATSYSQMIWKGLGFYQQAPALSGTWSVPGVSTGPWTVAQSLRSVTVKWTGGTTQPNVNGEFRGTLISHDKDSTVQGFYVSTTNGVSTTPRAMSFTWSPATPNNLVSSNGFNLTRS